MNDKFYFNNPININEITMVSAFYDIGRDNWNNSKRSAEYYIDSFIKMSDFYLNQKIIVFMDDRYIDYLLQKMEEKSKHNKIFISINFEWLNNNCNSWKKNNLAIEIMNSKEYKNLLNERIKCGAPENNYPEYNTINHSKIDFIKYSIDNILLNENEFICWCDFGYFKSILHDNPNEFPKKYLDINKFNLNKLNFCLVNKIDETDSDMFYSLANAPEKFTGSFFAGSKELMLKLYELYHNCLDELYRNNLSDDDQHVYLRCYLKNNDLFELFLSSDKKWPQALSYFQKD